MAPTLLALATLLAAPQRADTARVRVEVTGEGRPLARATVRLGARALATGAAGTVVLTAPPGPAWLTARAVGFAPDSVRLTLRAGQDTTVALALEPLPAELEEITVQSTRTGRRIDDEPLRVEVLGREEIEEKLLMTPGDITMMLNETGGLRVQTTAPALGAAGVRVQGLRGRYTAVLADGLPLYGGQVGGLGLLQIPPMDLGQVEVIKGAASALYGAQAMGGVINLLSRRPDGARELLLNATSFGGTDAVAWAAGPAGDPVGWTLLAGAHRQGRVDRDGDGWTDVPGHERLVLRPRVFARDARGRSLLVTAGLTLEDRRGGTVAGGAVPGGGGWREALATTRGDFGAVGSALVGGAWLLTARASAALLRHTHRFGSATERDRHLTWFGEVALTREAGPVLVVAGAGLQGDRYRHRDLPAFDYTFSVPGLFAQAEWTPAAPVTLALSARLDHHDRYGTFATPRLSALGRLAGGWTLRASAGTGWFAPTPFTEETEATGLARLAPPAGLRAETARGAAVDLGGTLGPLEVNATLFASSVAGAVRVEPAADGAFRLANAPAPTRTHGLDLLARLHRGPWHATATWTLVRATEPDPDGPGRRAVPLTPRHTAGLVASWEREGQTRVGVEVYFTGRQALDDNPYRARSRSYTVAGALVEQRVGGVRLFLNLENLTDVRQTRFDPLVLPVRAPDGRWTTDAWAPLDGRAVNGGVRLAW